MLIKRLSMVAVATLALVGGAQATVTTSTVGNTTTYTENFDGGSSFSGGSWTDTNIFGPSDDYLWMLTNATSSSYTFSSASAISSLSLDFWYAGVGSGNTGSVTLTSVGTTNLANTGLLASTNNPGAATGGTLNVDNYDAHFHNSWNNLAAGTYTLTFARTGNGKSLKIDDVSIQVTAVPEPAGIALALAGFGVMGLAATRRRRRV